jgi:uncharacterized membrane protein
VAEGDLFQFPEIAEVPLTRPFTWLKRGAEDFRAAPLASMFYGLTFAVMGCVLHAVFQRAPQYTTTLAMGFLLVGPLLSIGLYDLSRQRERGDRGEHGAQDERPRLLPSLTAWRDNLGGIGIYVLILTVVFLVWGRASLVTFALFESRAMPSWEAFMAQMIAMKNLEFVFAFFGVGLIFALIVFVFSVISIPHLLAVRADAVTAAAVSVVAVTKSTPAMILWALLVVLLVGIGLASAFIGLIFTAPWVGHATWHAYRDIVRSA